MKTPRTLRTIARSLLGAALTSASAFAITPDDLAALRAKAATGDGIAQHNLGLVYANSQEAVTDLVEAYAWLNLAADNGATGRSLMIVTRQMTPEQVADGKRRFEQIREAIVANKTVPPAASPVSAVAQKNAPVSPVSESPVSASPIRAVGTAAPDTDAQQAELKKIGAELAAAWKENDQLKTAVATAEKNAREAAIALKAERDQLATSLEGATHEIAGMKAAAANFEGERNGLLQKIATAQQASDGELRLKLVALENELAKAGAVAKELDAAKQSLVSLGEQQQKLTAENQRLSSLTTEAEKTATNRAAESEKALAALRAELATTQTQQAEAAKKIAAGDKAASDLAAAQTRIRSLESDATRFSAEKQDLTGKLTAAAAAVVPPAEIARMNSQLTDLKERVASSQQALALANAEAASLKQELQGAKSGVVPVQQHRELQAKLDARAAEQQKTAQAELKKVQETADAEKARLTAELAAATAASTQEIGSLKAAAANFEGERNALLKKIAETEQALARAVADVSSTKEQLAAAQASSGDVARTAAEVARLTQELDAAKKAGGASQQAIADARAENADLKQQLADAKAGVVPAQQYQELQTALDAALKAQEQQHNSGADLQKTIVALEAEKNSLTEKLEALSHASTGEATALKAAAANFEGERKGLLQKITEAEQAASRANAEAGSLKDRLAAAEKSSETPTQQLGQLQAKLDAATRAQETQQRQQAALQEANARLEAEGARLTRELAAAQAPSTEANRSTAVADDLQTKLNAAEAAAAAASAERETLAQRVAVLEQQVSAPAAPASGEDPAELRKQLDEASSKLAATLRSFQLKQEEIDLLQKSLVSTDGERAALAERIYAVEKQATEVRAASVAGQEASAQLAAMREQLRHAQNQLGQLAAENVHLKNRTTPVAYTPVLSAPRRPADTTSPTTTAVRAPQVAEARVHTVVEGETLTRIARRYYGNSERWADIYDANRASLPNPAALKIGMKLRIP
jgi:chromosome segregation ATPase